MKTLERTDAPVRCGQMVTVAGMPAYGPMRVIAVKWSFVSGWWVDVLDDSGGMWVVAADQAVVS